MRVVVVPDGAETPDGTSYRNERELDAIEAEGFAAGTVVVCPYAAQCRRLLGRALGLEVHTVDSFQGREADTIVLSLVRDGSAGMGFWSDYRRLVVALTRARTELVLVVSNPAGGRASRPRSPCTSRDASRTTRTLFARPY